MGICFSKKVPPRLLLIVRWLAFEMFTALTCMDCHNDIRFHHPFLSAPQGLDCAGKHSTLLDVLSLCCIFFPCFFG